MAPTLASYSQRNMGTDIPILLPKKRFFGFEPSSLSITFNLSILMYGGVKGSSFSKILDF